TSGVPPNPTSSGGAVTAWTIMTHLLDLGHDVFVCGLTDAEHYDPASRTWEERTQLVRDRGGEFVNVPSAAAGYFRTLPRDLPARPRHQPRVLVRLLQECAAAGAFAAHHSAWLRSRGVAGCEYLRTPVPDPGPVERREADRPRILLVGHMKGVVTLEGLRSFA